MYGKHPPSHMNVPERCGICKAPKHPISYNAATHVGVEMRNVALCTRCDLSPDPPLQRDGGVG